MKIEINIGTYHLGLPLTTKSIELAKNFIDIIALVSFLEEKRLVDGMLSEYVDENENSAQLVRRCREEMSDHYDKRDYEIEEKTK